MQDSKGSEFKKRRSRTGAFLRMVRIYGVSALLVVVAFSLSFAAWHMFDRFRLAEAGAMDAQRQLAVAQGQERQVEQDLQNLSTPQGVEGALREQYGVAKPGEGVIKIIGASSSASSTVQPPPSGFFARIWQALFP